MNKKLENGFSILEVMIALLVISTAALGLTKAQISALQTVSDAGLRTTASILVQDMAARIQANAGEAVSGTGNNPQTSGYCLNPTGYTCSGIPASNTNCLDSTILGNICTSNQMALQDIYEWQQLITNAFPADSNPLPIISAISPTSGSQPQPVYTITIYWQSWKSRANGTTCSSSNLSGCDQSVTATVTPPLVNVYSVIGGGMMP